MQNNGKEGDMMKKKSIRYIMLSFLLVVISFSNGSILTFAEGNGAVQTNGNIILTEDSETKPTDSTEATTESKEVTSSSKTSEALASKPVGKYPSTGELVRASLSISGGVLAIIAVCLLYVKRRNNADSRREE